MYVCMHAHVTRQRPKANSCAGRSMARASQRRGQQRYHLESGKARFQSHACALRQLFRGPLNDVCRQGRGYAVRVRRRQRRKGALCGRRRLLGRPLMLGRATRPLQQGRYRRQRRARVGHCWQLAGAGGSAVQGNHGLRACPECVCARMRLLAARCQRRRARFRPEICFPSTLPPFPFPRCSCYKPPWRHTLLKPCRKDVGRPFFSDPGLTGVVKANLPQDLT